MFSYYCLMLCMDVFDTARGCRRAKANSLNLLTHYHSKGESEGFCWAVFLSLLITFSSFVWKCYYECLLQYLVDPSNNQSATSYMIFWHKCNTDCLGLLYDCNKCRHMVIIFICSHSSNLGHGRQDLCAWNDRAKFQCLLFNLQLIICM